VNNAPSIKTLGELIAAGYTSKSIKQELRENLITRMKAKMPMFDGIIGYQDTVIPDLERALLSKHNINLLGLRGQAKTRIARLMVNLLDEWIPVVQGSELNDDPLQPLSRYARDLVAEKGNATPIEWLHRSERFAEKLATPDVSVADLIGDVDPIKAANQKLSYSDERVIHYGIIPRANRCIFVINELPGFGMEAHYLKKIDSDLYWTLNFRYLRYGFNTKILEPTIIQQSGFTPLSFSRAYWQSLSFGGGLNWFYPINDDLKFSLETILKRKVDLLEEKAIKNPYFKKAIEKNKQLIYG
jgi:hypothetical protein